MRRFSVVMAGATCAGVVAVAASSKATVGPPYPDSETCNVTNDNCLNLVNSASGGTAIRATGEFAAVWASSTSGDGVFGAGKNGVEGFGTGSSASYGVYGLSNAAQSAGVYGVTGGSQSYGVYGSSTTYIGVFGQGSARGVQGSANTVGGIGVGGASVPGTNSKGLYGVLSQPGVGYAVFGENPSGSAGAYAGFFSGNVRIIGTSPANALTVSGPVSISGNVTVAGNITATGTITPGASDARLKKNILPITGAVDQIAKLRGVTFEWNEPEKHTGVGVHRGFIAQEVEKVFPHWVRENDEGFKTVNTTEIDALLVESVRSLKTENDGLRDRIKALEAARVFAAAGLQGNGMLGLGLMVLGGAIVVSKRRLSVRPHKEPGIS